MSARETPQCDPQAGGLMLSLWPLGDMACPTLPQLPTKLGLGALGAGWGPQAHPPGQPS